MLVNSDFNTSDIQQGMDVYDSTGDKIGNISDVYQNAGMGGSGSWGAGGNDTNSGVGDVIVEEIDIVTTPDYNAGPDTGSSDTSSTGGFGGTGTSNYDTTGGIGSTDSGMGTTTGYGTSTAGAGTGTMASTGYFKVSEGGVLGIGATDLYIPFSAISSVTSDGVNLNCTKDQAEQQYQQKPAFLQNQDSNTF